MIGAFWANIAVLLTLLAVTRPKISTAIWLGLISGLLFGLAWVSKESVIYLIPFLAITILLLPLQSRYSVRLATLGGHRHHVVGMLFGETGFYAKATGDPVFRFSTRRTEPQGSRNVCFDESSPYFGWEDRRLQQSPDQAVVYRRAGRNPVVPGVRFSALPGRAGHGLGGRLP